MQDRVFISAFCESVASGWKDKTRLFSLIDSLAKIKTEGDIPRTTRSAKGETGVFC